LDFNAGYVLRYVDGFPKQGVTPPWELNMDYVHDRKVLLEGPVGDHLRFGGRSVRPDRPDHERGLHEALDLGG
jgi:hypothetical protein